MENASPGNRRDVPFPDHRSVAMYIGLGIVLLVLGLILTLDVITVDISYVNDDALGWILVIAGVLAIVLSLVLAPRSRRNADTY
jgi:uncharacterized membrane protein HdeD (DUF308 family)